MHSLVYGTPVLSHDVPHLQAPEYEAIVPGRNGMLFRKDDEDDLVRAIREWFALDIPPAELDRNCKEVIDKYYTPDFQVQVFNAAVAGMPATELPLAEELNAQARQTRQTR
jgi:hypothetical protein